MFNLDKNKISIGVAVLAILITGVLLLGNASGGPQNILSYISPLFGMPSQAVAKKALNYINANMLPAGQSAILKNVVKENGLIKITITIADKDYDSYVTTDGKLLFPSASSAVFIDESKVTKPVDANTNATQITPDNVAKVAKTSLDAYVVSSCPFGLQMQRAMASAITGAPELAQNINVRYIGEVSGNTITAMHGQEEADENLRQICIRDEQKSKYWDYVSCYMKKVGGSLANGMPLGDSKTCQTTANIDKSKLNSCVTDVKRGVAYAKEDFDLAKTYGITGSPTLVLNGQKIDETPFGGRSADAIRNIICSSSSKPSDFCAKKLDTTSAAVSFSLTYASNSPSSAPANTNCAPAK